MTGLWDMDPEDSSWYHLEQKDKTDPSIVIPMGSICYRYDILLILGYIIRVDIITRTACDEL